jgi:hypothetical protein
MNRTATTVQWVARPLSAVALCALLGATAFAQSQTNKMRIGVYDSRAIAIAYGNSAEFQNYVKSVRAEYEKAKSDKNDKLMKEIDARMRVLQRRMHEQGFSTGSVADLIVKVKDSLPAVAKKANVRLIVSKWDVNYQSPDVELVDVTDELVAQFHPNENVAANPKVKVLDVIKGLKNQPPEPMEKITDNMN